MHRPLLLFACVLIAALKTSASFAQEGVDAQALFNEAKRDVESGQVELACPKFRASYEASGVVGALLSWADCEERRGHLLEARELWKKGAGIAASDPERAQYVSMRLSELEQRIAREGVTPPAPPSAPPPATKLSPAPVVAPKPKADSGEGLRLAGWIVGGIGVGGAAAFVGTAIAIATTCADWTCPEDLQPTLIANAGLGGVAGVALGLGAIFLGVGFTQGGDEPQLHIIGVGDLGIGLSLEI